MRWFIFILCLVQYHVHAFDWSNRTVRIDFINGREAYTQFESLKPSASPQIITGGINATNGQYPWTVFILSSSPGGQGFYCSGTIISDTFFLTDLRCMGQGLTQPASSMGIYVGSVEWSWPPPPPEHFVRHFWYIAPSPENSPNIALCRIHVPLTFTPNVQPIRLPNAANTNFTYDGWSSLIVGYRLQAPIDRLQFVQSNIFNNNACIFLDGSIGDHELCGPAGNDPHVNGSLIRFTGFSGGPWMVYEYAPDYDLHPVIIGINHYQFANQTGSYGLATRVSHFVEWIETLTGGLFT